MRRVVPRSDGRRRVAPSMQLTGLRPGSLGRPRARRRPAAIGVAAAGAAPGLLGGSDHRITAISVNEAALITKRPRARPSPAAGPRCRDRRSRRGCPASPRPSSRVRTRARRGRGWGSAPRSPGRRRWRSRPRGSPTAAIANRGPSTATSQAIASMHTARARSVVRRTSRRSKRSAMTPAGIDSRMYGSIRAAPTMPRMTGSPVAS